MLDVLNDPIRVVLTCGLPASGKTTAAGWIHARAGGLLVRSCDVYQTLGISLPEWVRRTHGFTADATGYLRERDRAYEVMGELLAQHLAGGAGLVVLDAVHGERSKREAVYRICAANGARAVLLWSRCDDLTETRRRFALRQGREADPEHEASDLSVYRHIASLWEDPREDALVARGVVPVVVYDTLAGTVVAGPTAPEHLVEVLRAAILSPMPHAVPR